MLASSFIIVRQLGMMSQCEMRLFDHGAPHTWEGIVDIRETPGVALDPEEAETRAIHELIDVTGRDVLEIGCGNGRLTRRFASGARSMLGVDLDAEGIALAAEQLPEPLRSVVTFQVADITAIDLPAAAFDVALLSWSL